MPEKKASKKKAYITPKLDKLGSITELTLGSTGTMSDMGGPTGGMG